LTVYGQEDLVLPILELLAGSPGGLTTRELIDQLWTQLTPTGENVAPSPSRPGERKFDQIVRNTTGPERHRLTGLVKYGGPGKPMAITAAGSKRLADARASGEWTGFGVRVPRGRPVRTPRGRRRRPPAKGFGAPYRPVNAGTSKTTRAPFKVDPNVIDRGTAAHKRLQTSASDALVAIGLEPLSPSAGDPDFDVGWRVGDIWFVGEVKSLTAANEATQVRLGIAQLLEYRYVLRLRHPDVKAVLILEREPDTTRWLDLFKSLEIEVVWPGTIDAYLATLV
jgi:hypothetical protein